MQRPRPSRAGAHPPRLRLQPLEDRTVPTTIAEVEANNTFATAQAVPIATGDVTTTAPADWLTVTGSVATNGDNDYYSFTLSAASGVFFDIDSRDIGLSTTLDSFLSLFNSGGTAISGANNDDGYDFEGFTVPTTSTGDATSRDSSLYFDLAAGTYAIRVTSFNGTSSGAYHLRLLADSTYSASPPAFASNPGATDTLYLDFDGHAATDAWGTYTATPYDFNGNSGQYSPAERLAIQSTWKGIAEDYSPFALNVTTAAAPATMVAGQSFRMVYTNSPASIVGAGGGGTLGVCFVNVYGTGGAGVRTGFTFAANFSTFGDAISGQIMAKPVEMANTSAHEFGHALGLAHYPSQTGGTGTVLPGALMGTPDLGLNRERWAAGTTTAGAAQDDMAVISNATNTFGYRADDHAATTGTATVLAATGNTYTAAGIVAQVADADWFRVVASGATTITVDVSDYAADLDVVLRLRDASGAEIAAANSAATLDATISQTLAHGTYYLDVQGTGAAGIAGQYSLRVDTSVLAPPTLTGIETAALAYTENQSLAVTGTLAVADPDSANLQGATVTLSAGYAAGQDFLDFTNQGGISGSFATGTLTLTGTATLAAYQAALRSVQYRNSSENPSAAARTVAFRVTDPDGNPSNVATRSITVTAVNDPPVADNDAYSTNEDVPLTVSAAMGVLDGDTDPEGTTLTAVLVDNVQHGSLTLNANGSFTYTPALNYNGPDSFTYRASDGSAQSNLATVTLTINAVNDAPAADNDAYSVNEDGTLTVPAGAGVLDGDTDAEGSPLTAALVDDVQHGTLSLAGDGSFTYTPAANYNGTDTFTYRANDGALNSTPATVTITVNPVNDVPTADDDAYSTNEDIPLTVPAATGVLDGDADLDGDPLTAVLVDDVQHGSLALNANGSFTYTPAANYVGSDSFTYRATDGTVPSNLATVSLTITAVNDPPVADDDAYSTSEDTPLTIPAATGVLDGDTDAEGAALTAVLVDTVQHGTLTLNADGSFTYTPTANYNGTDTFTYRASDGSATSNLATVTLAIDPVNDAPTATPDSYTVAEDGTLTVGTPGVLGNDPDPDGDTLTAVLVDDVQHGTLALNANGSFTYTPITNYNGSDSFTYLTDDGTVTVGPVTVTLTVTSVNDDPVAVGEGYTTPEDVPLVVGAPGVLGNDTDVDGDTLAAVPVAGPAHGTLTLNLDGSFTYTPAANYDGPDSFTYAAADGTATTPAVTVGLTVAGANDAPTPGDDAAALKLKRSVTISVLTNDTDPEGNPFSIQGFTQPTKGTVKKVGNTFVYTATGPLAGADSFTYTIVDSLGAAATATVQIAIADPVAPTLTAVRARYGVAGLADLKSFSRTSLPWVELTRFELGFSEDAIPTAGALTLTGPAGAVPLTLATVPAGGAKTATWSFAALAPGKYTLRLTAADVTDVNGNPLPVNYTRTFGILPGDFDGNGLVDNRDLTGIKKKFQANPAKADRFADVNGDGVVTVLDYDIAKAALGTRL
jgi:VCBS repeat-containing protein